MKWFRVYAEARTDAKLESLTDAQHRVWFRLLCFAADQDDRGIVRGYDEELLAIEVARGDVNLLRETLERLVKLRIIATGDDEVSFIHWRDRQYDKPSDAPDAVKERVSRHRQAKRNAPSNRSNADVTRGNATYTDADTDTDSETETEPEGSAAASARPRVKKHLPVTPEIAATAEVLADAAWIADAVPDIEQAVARSFELVPAFVASNGPFEAEKYSRHHAKAPPADWYRGWLNWLKNSLAFERPRPIANGRQPHVREPDNSGIDDFRTTLRSIRS